MKEHTTNTLRACLKAALATLPTPMRGGFPEQRWIFARDQNGGWQGSLEQAPNPASVLMVNFKQSPDLLDKIKSVMESDYPEYLKQVWIGNSAGSVQPSALLAQLLIHGYARYHTFALNDAQIETVLTDAAEFFDSRTFRFRLLAPILGLSGPYEVSPIKFPCNITMRPLSGEECSYLYGSIYPMVSNHPLILPDFVFVQDVDVPKSFEVFDTKAMQAFHASAQVAFERCMLVLSSFKEFGPIGYGGIHVRPLTLCLGPVMGTQMWRSDAVPLGHSAITREELVQLETHAAQFASIPKELEIACHRLVDANRRTKPHEVIIDAVIGLESILLYRIQQEMAFRFSLNYSVLPFVDDRHKEFKFARALYSLRSKIAHGLTLKASEVFTDEKLTLKDMADRARSALRKTICHFNKSQPQVEFSRKDFWENRQLNLRHK